MLSKLHMFGTSTIVLFGLGLGSVVAQTPQGASASFEVASIRPVGQQELKAVAAQGFNLTPCSGGFELSPGRIRITGATAFRLIAAAYGQPCGAALELKLTSGGPDWVQKEPFHIEAILPAGAPDYSAQQLQNNEAPVLQAMLRTLLAERFQLTVRSSTKETSTYSVTFVKEGKIKLSEDQTPTQLSTVSGARGNFDMGLDRTAGIVRMRATAIPLSRLITPMQGRDDRMVIDRTGMTGLYDIAPIAIDVGPSAPGVSVWPEILRALGFKVEAARGPVEFLTIERIERPTEN